MLGKFALSIFLHGISYSLLRVSKIKIFTKKNDLDNSEENFGIENLSSLIGVMHTVVAENLWLWTINSDFESRNFALMPYLNLRP